MTDPSAVRSPEVRLSFELTDGCNLRCVHCFKTLEDRPSFLEPALIERILDDFERLGIPLHVALTGGEPTLHSDLEAILGLITARGLPYSLVTNGIGFLRLTSLFKSYHHTLEAISFSLDGARVASHDALRGSGRFRETLSALVHCRENGLPTQINCVITPANREEMDELARLATTLGCRALGLAHCKPTPDNLIAGLVMDPAERRRVEADIARLQQTYRMPILLAGDHFDPNPLAACPQLALREFHIDPLGRLRACCELGAWRGGRRGEDILLDLHHASVADGLAALAEISAGILREKAAGLRDGTIGETERFICTMCYRHWGVTGDR